MAQTLKIIVMIVAIASPFRVNAAGDTLLVPSNVPPSAGAHFNNPAAWISDCYNRLNDIYLMHNEFRLDTGKLVNELNENDRILEFLTKGYYPNKAALNLRSVYNIKMRAADLLSEISAWQARVHLRTEKLVGHARQVLLIKQEISNFNLYADSLFRSTFSETIDHLTSRQAAAENTILSELKRTTALENKIIDAHLRAYTFMVDVNSLLRKKESNLLKQELPPVWKSPPSVYKSTIGQVIANSFWQTMDSIKYYGEMSLWRIVLFRGLILLLCLIPIKVFSDQERKHHILESTSLVFLGHFPKTASLIMGLAFAPVVFVHPPHAFMELILIGLVFTVTMVTLKIYPKVDKIPMFILIGTFLLLYIINFFVTPTFFGRWIYVCSVLTLIPLFYVIRKLPVYGLKYEKTVRVFYFLLALHIITGTVFVVLGYYTLGRSVVLSGFSLLIIIMIMRIAVHTILDYMEIIIYFLNRRFTTIQINGAYFREKIKPFLFLLAIAFILVTYLYTLSIFEILKSAVVEFLFTPREVGSAVFTYRSVLLFFIWVYVAFLLASLLRFLFEPQLKNMAQGRSRLGSYLLLIRMLIICTGIILGILASGIPLSNFTVFLGAIGVGIGFGLQNIVGNLISGVIIAIERPFVVGDVLDFGTETGLVKEISLRATMVSTTDKADILIPNSTLLSQNLKNWTISSKERSLDLRIITAPAHDPNLVIERIGKCLDEQPDIIREKSMAYFTEIDENGFHFVIRVHITDLTKVYPVKSHLLSNIRTKFDEAGIRFSQRFPQVE